MHKLIMAALTGAALPALAMAQTAPTPAPAATRVVPLSSWMGQGSDIPADPSWRFGTLPNGLRFAVRHATQPPGTISIRVRVGVGGLMESDTQQGWSHLLEHMSFRGTARYADGEGIKVWQRLGASFGADTNAATTLTATTYQLDLPRADAASYREAMGVLADMMDTARIDPKLLATERKVVEAELAQRLSPLTRKIKDAQQPLLFAGTKAAQRDVLGTPAMLEGATAATLKAYYEAWYRPDNAVVVVAGDADLALLEAEVRRTFGGWRGTGPTPPAPDWGSPVTLASPVATVADAQAPDVVAVAFIAPHSDRAVTSARQQEQWAEELAIRILNQRLATLAREDAAFVNAGVSRSEQRHIQDQVILQVQPRPGQWQTALKHAYAVLNVAAATPPDPAEIEQQFAVMTSALQQRVASAGTATGATLANAVVQDVEDNDVEAAPDYYAKLFATARTGFTPTAIQRVIRRVLAPAPRLLVIGPQEVAGGPAAAQEALAAAQRTAGGASAKLRAVSLDDLKLAGTPAAIRATVPLSALDATRTRLSNGIELVVKRTAFENDRVRVRVEVGAGLAGEPRGDLGLWWTASALPAAGIGPFTPEEFARVTAGRQIGFSVGAGSSALTLLGATNATDLVATLKLMTGEVAQPRFDEATVARVKTGALANYASIYSQPAGVLQAFGGGALHGGDDRFAGLPSRDVIERLTLADFQRFWTSRLAQGPVRVVIVGDVDPAAAAAAVAQTLGTLAPRLAVTGTGDRVRATPPAQPVVLRHRGDPGQALVVRAYPTPGALDDPAASAALELAGSLIQTRLTEGFRETEGATYTPLATLAQTPSLPHYGVLIAGAQVQAARVAGFGTSLDAVVSALGSRAADTDAFARAQLTAISTAQRNRQSNEWWVGALGGDLTPARIDLIAGREARLKQQTPATVQAAIAHYLSPDRGFVVEVLPEAGLPPSREP